MTRNPDMLVIANRNPSEAISVPSEAVKANLPPVFAEALPWQAGYAG
jgi:hypothetical protein